VKDFWSSRPRRARRGRKIAGVAAGIGNRYDIDPVIVRVALVVATFFGGLGVLFYLLGWLLLPDERDEVSAIEALFGKGRSSTPPYLTIGLCIALFPATGWAFGGSWFQGSGIALTVLLVVGLFVLHRSRGGMNRPAARPHTSAAAPASFSAQQTTLDADSSTESNYQPPAGVWDPLGAEPLGWQLPGEDPVAAGPSAEPPAPRRRSPGVAVTLGATLLTAGVGTTLALLGVEWFTAAHVIGMTLAVLGIGMVISAFNGSGRGLLALAVPLSVAGLLVTTLPMADFPAGGFGELDARPTSAAEVKPVYERTGGSVTLDLTDLPESSAPVDTAVRVGMGEAVVIVPIDADVTYTCDSSMGDMNCLGRTQDGMGLEQLTGRHLGENGEGGTEIKLDVSSVMGSVEVRRGS
jgi:phage shock protein PspC (stress-responsive transcriptional regulator)